MTNPPSNTNPFTNTTTFSSVSAPALPTFSDFQFKTIGQTPDLLKRMTAVANTDAYVYDPSDNDDAMSTEADPPQEDVMLEFSEKDSDAHKHRSLRERMAIPPDYDMNETPMSTQVTGTLASNIFNWKPAPANNVDRTIVTTTNEDRSIIRTSNTSLRPGPSQQCTIMGSATATGNAVEPLPIQDTRDPLPTRIDIRNASHLSHSQNSQGTSAKLSPPQTTHISTFDDVQTRLATSLASLTPINTTDALSLAENTKDRFAEVSASAQRAYMLAEKAIKAAEESRDSANECITLVGTLQAKNDELLAAIAKIDNDEQRQQEAVQCINKNVHELDQWGKQMKIERQREQDEIQAERRIYATIAQHQAGPSGSRSTPFTQTAPVSHVSPAPPLSLTSESSLVDVDHEAAALEAFEQRAEQRRIAATERIRAREEEEKEEQRKQEEHYARVAVARAKRIEEEEEERTRQLQEDQEVQRQRQALERKREAAQRKASEERALKAAAAEEAHKAYLQVQQEERARKESLAKEAAERQRQTEEASALARREEELQQKIRQDLAAPKQHKQRFADDEAKKTQLERTKSTEATQLVPSSTRTLILTGSQIPSASTQDSISLSQLPVPTPGTDSKSLGNFLTRREPRPNQASDPNTAFTRIPVSATSPSALVPFERHPPSSSASSIINVQSASRTSTVQSIYTKETLATPANNLELSDTPGIQRDGFGAAKRPQHHASLGSHPTADTKLLGAQTDRHNNNSCDGMGHDVSNVALISSSQILPISAATRKANFRHLMKVEPIGPSIVIKNEDEGDKPLIKVERDPTPPISSMQPTTSQVRNEISPEGIAHVGLPHIEHERQLSTGVPFLSLPSPGPAHKASSVAAHSAAASEVGPASLKSYHFGTSAQNIVPGQPLRGAPSISHNQPPVPDVSQTVTGARAGLPSQSATFMGSVSLTAADRMSTGQPNPVSRVPLPAMYLGNGLPTRVEAQALVLEKGGSWTQASAAHEKVRNPALNHKQSRAQSPQRQVRHGGDHWSPKHRTGLAPRGSHWQSPSYMSYPHAEQRPMQSRSRSRGSESANNSRAATPEPQMYQHQALHQPPLKRKRAHLVDQTNEPPNRRQRYDPEGEISYGAHPAERSHVANYSRSPTPEQPRATPLHMRLGEAEDRRLQVQDTNYRNTQDFPNKQRSEQYQYRAGQSPVHVDEPFNHHAARQTRRHTPESRTLLDRFTDQVPNPSNNHNHNHHHHASSSRGARARGRGGAHQPSSGHRNTKGNLIDRIEAPNYM